MLTDIGDLTSSARNMVQELLLENALYLEGNNEPALLLSRSTTFTSLEIHILSLRKQMWIAQKIWLGLQKDESTKDSNRSEEIYKLALSDADMILLLSRDIDHRNSAVKLKMLLLPVESLMEQYSIGKEDLDLSSLDEEKKWSLTKELLNSLLGKLKHSDPIGALKAFEEAKKGEGLDDHTVISGHIYHNAGDAELKIFEMSLNKEHLEKALLYWKKALEQYPTERKADKGRVQEKIEKAQS